MSPFIVILSKKGLEFLSRLETLKSLNSLIKKDPTKPEPPIIEIVLNILLTFLNIS